MDIALADLESKNPFTPIKHDCPLSYELGGVRLFISNEFESEEWVFGNAEIAVRGYRGWMEGRERFYLPTVVVRVEGRTVGVLAISTYMSAREGGGSG